MSTNKSSNKQLPFFEIGNNVNFTNVNYDVTPGRLKLIDERTYSFWKDYCNEVQTKRLSFGERLKHHMPIVVNIYLSFSNIIENFQHELWGFIMEMVYSFQCSIFEYLKQPDDQPNILTCCILSPNKHFMNRDGFITYHYRLQFPYCRCSPKFQEKTILPDVLQNCRQNNILEKIDINPENDLKDIITLPVESVPLYGSSINPKHSNLTLTAILHNITDIDLDSQYELIDERLITNLSDVFDPHLHYHVESNMIDRTVAQFDEFSLDFWIPMFLSLNYYTKVVQPKQIETQIPTTPNSVEFGVETHEGQAIFENLIGLVKPNRFHSESGWTELGKCLHYIYNGHHRGKSIWMDITSKHTSFKAQECNNKYDRFTKKPLITHKTIAWYAKEDNKEGYDIWQRKWIQPSLDMLFDDMSTITHADAAQVLYRKYWLDFVYDENQWYEFYDHGWNTYATGKKDALSLQVKIASHFQKFLEDVRLEYILKQKETLDTNENNQLETKVTVLSNFIKKIKTMSFLRQMVDYSVNYFSVKGFCNQLNLNPKTMRVKNGIIECTSKAAVFRRGKPEDYISICAGVKYNQALRFNDKNVEEFMYWVKQMFIKYNVIEYFLRLNASFLHGGNLQKLFIVFTGEKGNNSKSTFISCMKQALGDYHMEIPTAMLTNKRGSAESANPAMARLEFARVCCAKETDQGEKLQAGVIKELTGNDSIFARKLFDNGKDIKPQIKLILACNTLSEINYTESAIKNRLINIMFNSVWSNDAPETIEEQFKQRIFKADQYFDDKLPELAEAFLWVIVQYYEKSITDPMAVPAEIMENTEAYWRSNDLFQQFVDGNLIQETNPAKKDTTFIPMKDCWNVFVNWMGEEHPTYRLPDSKVFYKEMDNKLGKLKDKRWYSWRLPDQVIL
jgi:phage/plasmid-associated DNA primase